MQIGLSLLTGTLNIQNILNIVSWFLSTTSIFNEKHTIRTNEAIFKQNLFDGGK